MLNFGEEMMSKTFYIGQRKAFTGIQKVFERRKIRKKM